MSAYMSATITVRDPEAFQRYADQARPTIAAHGGAPVVIGKVAGTLTGTVGHNFAALFRFDDTATLQGWYDSPEYQALVPLRDAAADVVFTILEEV